MFEVGKRYTYDYGNGAVWLITAVGKSMALAICEKQHPESYNIIGRETTIANDAFKTGDFSGWKEVILESKRWSTWQGVHEEALHSFSYRDRQQAIEASSYRAFNSRPARHATGYLIRRDFEQHEGKEAVCVNVELEKV